LLKFFFGELIILDLLSRKLKIALTYNVKPEDSVSSIPPVSSNYLLNSSDSFNDTYAEWDTFETINAVKNALEFYHEVHLVEANEYAYNTFKMIKPNIVFNIAEGHNGTSREAQIPAMLEMLRIPYTGSDPLTLAICLDKGRTKEILSYHKIPNSPFKVVYSLNDAFSIELNFPLIVKPLLEGSSKGIFSSNLIYKKDDLIEFTKILLDKYNQPVIVEEYLPGREFTVAILNNDEEAEVLPIIEINFSEFPENLPQLYSYEATWIIDSRENPLDIFSCPANITKSLENEIKNIALKTYRILRCKDWSRIDIRMDKKGKPNIIEVNPLPGILPDPKDNSCYPKAARAKGLSYDELINQVLLSAVKRYNL